MTSTAYLAFEPDDEAAARAAAAELERQGYSPILAGPLRSAENLPRLIETISQARFVVLFASAASQESKWLPREIAAALNNGRPVIIARTGELGANSWIGATLDLSDSIDFHTAPQTAALSQLADLARKAGGSGRVIAMLNIKGGVGKTVLAANLFAAAHLADKRSVSFIDLDPQHNLTQYFLSPGERNRIRDRNHTIYGVLSGRGLQGLKPADFGGVAAPLTRAKNGRQTTFELVAGDERLFEYTLDTRTERDKAEAFTRFRALISALRARSEAVVIDANPCATFLTRLAVAAADHVVAPVRPEKYSLTGLNMLELVVREVRGRALRPDEFSVLLNGVNDRTRSAEIGDPDAMVRDEILAAPFFGSALLEEEIPYSPVLRSVANERIATTPINVTAMMRVGGRPAKEALTAAAAAILRRSAP